jgi:hypothetical protein
MADEADRANDHWDQVLAAALTKRKPVGIKPNNQCHNCDDDVADGVLFCTHECHEDYERRERAKARNGQ